ncbi:hypothetical protein HD553DRAFT_322163 [Filobasidium floriforme]|uniref:uncharacterized protein n=1 Tax=Filobasidium floriforme TaxID=5210 RepID=UPI001E8ED775|nr:uncharacterized protein HD553DRAFT_322163 [Filobasidium floriforme]KAH8089364.1 hypothetical protein HD553DRAFT_322163 [Filobasidium floriforme]
MLMFRNPFATSTLALVLAFGWATPLLHVRAQEGVSYVMSNDGTLQYPCEGAALAEVYYQDKCSDSDETFQFTANEDSYDNDDNSFCDYIADKLTPDCTLFDSSILGDKCQKLVNIAFHGAGWTPPPQPSGTVIQKDGFVVPRYVCPTHIDAISSVLTKLVGGLDLIRPYVCKFKGFECITFEDGKPSLSNNPLCPAQLCPNHFTNDLTRRRLQPPAIAARQVDTAALRRRAMAARPSRGGSPRRLARDEHPVNHLLEAESFEGVLGQALSHSFDCDVNSLIQIGCKRKTWSSEGWED